MRPQIFLLHNFSSVHNWFQSIFCLTFYYASALYVNEDRTDLSSQNYFRVFGYSLRLASISSDFRLAPVLLSLKLCEFDEKIKKLPLKVRSKIFNVFVFMNCFCAVFRIPSIQSSFIQTRGLS